MNVKKIITTVGAAALSINLVMVSPAYAANGAEAAPSPGINNIKKEFNLEDYAKKLGIDTKDKTEEQLKKEIKEVKLQKSIEFLKEKGLYKEGMTEKEVYKKIKEYKKNNPK